MKNYLKRLKDHPGTYFATVWSLLFFVAALTNNNMSTTTAIIAGSLASGLIWSIVLISNIK